MKDSTKAVLRESLYKVQTTNRDERDAALADEWSDG